MKESLLHFLWIIFMQPPVRNSHRSHSIWCWCAIDSLNPFLFPCRNPSYSFDPLRAEEASQDMTLHGILLLLSNGKGKDGFQVVPKLSSWKNKCFEGWVNLWRNLPSYISSTYLLIGNPLILLYLVVVVVVLLTEDFFAIFILSFFYISKGIYNYYVQNFMVLQLQKQ